MTLKSSNGCWPDAVILLPTNLKTNSFRSQRHWFEPLFGVEIRDNARTFGVTNCHRQAPPTWWKCGYSFLVVPFLVLQSSSFSPPFLEPWSFVCSCDTSECARCEPGGLLCVRCDDSFTQATMSLWTIIIDPHFHSKWLGSNDLSHASVPGKKEICHKILQNDW